MPRLTAGKGPVAPAPTCPVIIAKLPASLSLGPSLVTASKARPLASRVCQVWCTVEANEELGFKAACSSWKMMASETHAGVC